MLENGALVRIDKPLDADLTARGELMLLLLRSDWTVAGTTHRSGTLLATGGYPGITPQPDHASLSLGKAGLRAAVKTGAEE